MIIFNLSESLSSSSSQSVLSHVYLYRFLFSPSFLLSVLYLHSLTSHLALSPYLPPLFLAFMSPCSAPSPSLRSVLRSASTPPPVLFSWSVRHNGPLVSGLAWLGLPATCFSSSFSRCLRFVPSASNRLFRVWDRLFLTLPSLGATGLSQSKRPDFLAWRVRVYLCASDFSGHVYVRACLFVSLCVQLCFLLLFFFFRTPDPL